METFLNWLPPILSFFLALTAVLTLERGQRQRRRAQLRRAQQHDDEIYAMLYGRCNLCNEAYVHMERWVHEGTNEAIWICSNRDLCTRRLATLLTAHQARLIPVTNNEEAPEADMDGQTLEDTDSRAWFQYPNQGRAGRER